MMRVWIKTMKNQTTDKPLLLVITGPTAVGKTSVSIHIASKLHSQIVSADARQFYRELKIGTASPTAHELNKVPHHFIGHLSIHDTYNVARYADDALKLLNKLFQKHPVVVLTGGSGLYIDTLIHGIDDLPDPDPMARKEVKAFFEREGTEGLRRWLRQTDPLYYEMVDTANPNRMMRALETFLTTGQTFSSLRQNIGCDRAFRTLKIVLNRPREVLFDRINQRTSGMVKDGLVEEAWSLFAHRHCNALNTVGYKEIYAWLANQWNLPMAVEKIKTNTRRYAKRQLTWFKRYDDAYWFHPDELDEMLLLIKENMRKANPLS